MTATYDTATDIGKIRLLIGDTDVTPATDAHFTDEELQVLLDLGGTIYLASALALEGWASTLTETVDSERIGDYSYTKKSADNKMKLAERYRSVDATEPAVAWAGLNITNIEETEEGE